jgi:hypothetical protein
VPDLGAPSSYLALQSGAGVYGSDGESLGEVEHVLADPDADIFDGLVIDRSVLPGGHRFVDAEQVEEVYERGVVLKLDRSEAESLPQPSENPAAMDVDPGEGVEGPLESKLRRAWELISGKG